MYESHTPAADVPRLRRTADQVEIDRALLAHIKAHVAHTGTAWAPLLLSEEWDASIKRLLVRGDVVRDDYLGGVVPASAQASMRDKQSRMLSYIKWRMDEHNGEPVKLRVLAREKAQAVVRLLLTGKLVRLPDGRVRPAADGVSIMRWWDAPVKRVKD